MKLKRPLIDEKAQQDMAFIMYHNPNGILAAIFSSMPLTLKQHCIRVGAVSGIIAEYAPLRAILPGMSRQDYANAVRYGGFYHDLGAYLRHNNWMEYPEAGKSILEREISERTVSAPIRQVILETVGCSGERCDGSGYPNHLPGGQIPFHAGICALADTVDMLITGRRRSLTRAINGAREYISDNSGTIFLPDVSASFEQAEDTVFTLYRSWRIAPPLWRYNDLKPAARPYDKIIG